MTTDDEEEQGQIPVVSGLKIGRNDPCVCGSGKKYKKCCLSLKQAEDLEHTHDEACSHGCSHS